MATWPELKQLMRTTRVQTARGVWRGVEPPEDVDDPQAPDPSDDERRLFAQRFVLAQPGSWLVAAEDGRPLRLCDGERVLLWTGPDTRPSERRLGSAAIRFLPDPLALLLPSEHDDWSRADDYSTPIRPPVRDEVAGRPCWRVDLAPPPHKTGVLSLWVDEATGVRLRLTNSIAGLLEELVELEIDGPVDPADFSYDGPVDRTEQDARDRDRAAWHHFHDNPPPLPTVWPRGLGFRVWGGDVDTGSVVVSLEVNGFAQLARDPVGGPAWQPPRSRATQVHRWSDGTWQWTLAVQGEPLSTDELQTVIESIPRTTRAGEERTPLGGP